MIVTAIDKSADGVIYLVGYGYTGSRFTTTDRANLSMYAAEVNHYA